jgi:hypothetical protein
MFIFFLSPDPCPLTLDPERSLLVYGIRLGLIYQHYRDTFPYLVQQTTALTNQPIFIFSKLHLTLTLGTRKNI